MTKDVHQLVNRLACRKSRAAEAANIAAEIGAEAFLVLLHDRAINALTPAPGFPQTLPGGPDWRAFLKASHPKGVLETELPYPDRNDPKRAQVLVGDEAVLMIIGGEPRLNVERFADATLLSALLRSEAEQLASAGLADAAREATARATSLATSLDKARVDLRRKAEELAQALQESDRLNEQLKCLNETLEQRFVERTSERNMLASIVETTDVMVMACDLNYNILAINKSNAEEFERVYGVRPSAGDNMLQLLAEQPEQQAQVRAGWARGLAGQESTFVEDFGDPARLRPYYEITFRVLRNEAGEQIGAYQFVTDVTDRLRKEAELLEAREALRQSQKMEAIGQLTGGVAHDFNNLLTPIVGSLDMLQRRNIGGEREKRLIAGAAQSAERAKTLVQRLLAFARRQPLQPIPVDIAYLVTGMADLIRSTSGPHIRVVVNTPDDLPPAHADPNQVEMALLNLSVNARDAMPQGGTLRITAGAVQIGPDHSAKLAPGDYIQISVVDDGIGMDERTLARAVEPFFSTKGVGQGTGLGLSMAHGLALQLGGALTIQSAPGLGTNVELWLPVSKSNVESGELPSVAPVKAQVAGTALLVDDEELVRASTAEMLHELGYKVVEAASAEEAASIMDGGLKPDLLVTDHLMAGMNGTDLARKVRSEQPSIQILIVSGYAEAESVAPDLPRLTKPFRIDELQTSLVKPR